MVTDISQLTGVWTRRSIEFPDGTRDETTRVWWVQGLPDFADLRIPEGRPSFEGVKGLEDCDEFQRKWLATQQGFAGTLVRQEEAWRWIREIDYQPPTGKRDIGTLRFFDAGGKTMIEDGVDERYTEVWERITEDGPSLVRRAPGAMLVAAGGHFILTVGTEPGVLEISHGLCRGDSSQWRITDSTHPWREGTLLKGS